MAHHVRFALLIGMLALAGCSGSKEPAKEGTANEPPPPPPPGTDPCEEPGSCIDDEANVTRLPQRIELLGCVSYFLNYAADAAKLQSFMPEGYTAGGLVGDLGLASVDGLVCQSAVIDNATVVEDFQFWIVDSLITPPAQSNADDDADLYAYEFIVSDPSVQAALEARGFIVSIGTLDATSDGRVLEVQCSIEGELVYDYMGGGDSNGTVATQEIIRIHQGNETGATFLDMHTDSHIGGAGEGGPMAVTGGAVSETMLNPGSSTAVHSAIGTGNIVFTFPEATP